MLRTWIMGALLALVIVCQGCAAFKEFINTERVRLACNDIENRFVRGATISSVAVRIGDIKDSRPNPENLGQVMIASWNPLLMPCAGTIFLPIPMPDLRKLKLKKDMEFDKILLADITKILKLNQYVVVNEPDKQPNPVVLFNLNIVRARAKSDRPTIMLFDSGTVTVTITFRSDFFNAETGKFFFSKEFTGKWVVQSTYLSGELYEEVLGEAYCLALDSFTEFMVYKQSSFIALRQSSGKLIPQKVVSISDESYPTGVKVVEASESAVSHAVSGEILPPPPTKQRGVEAHPILYFDVEKKEDKRQFILNAVYPGGRRLGPFEGALGATWAPDGKRFAFFTSDKDPIGASLVMTDLNGEAKNIYTTTGNEHIVEMFQPAWSPDGSSIAFVSVIPGNVASENVFSVVIIDISLGEERSRHIIPMETVTMITPDKFRWSPDGSKILLSCWRAVVVDTRTDYVEQITDVPVIADWTPNSDVYYLEKRNYHKPAERKLGGFYLKKQGTWNPVELMDEKRVEVFGLTMEDFMGYGNLSLSPNGTRLALIKRMMEKHLSIVYIYDLKAGETVILDKPSKSFESGGIIGAFEWSPDENNLAVLTFSKDIKENIPNSQGANVELKILDINVGEWRILDTMTLESKEVNSVLYRKTLSWTQ